MKCPMWIEFDTCELSHGEFYMWGSKSHPSKLLIITKIQGVCHCQSSMFRIYVVMNFEAKFQFQLQEIVKLKLLWSVRIQILAEI